MPRYYFHVEDDQTDVDELGVELPNLETARNEAVRTAGEILRDGAAKSLWTGKPWRMWVTQSPAPSGFELFSLWFSAMEKEQSGS
jgi:hypothetical protein